MSIHYDSQHTQEDVPYAIDEQETIAQPMGPPTSPPPQTPRPQRGKHERGLIVSVLLVFLVLILALGSVLAVQLLNQPAAHPTPVPARTATTAPAPTKAVTPTPAPTGAITPTPVPTKTPTPSPPVPVYQPINALWMSTATSGWAGTTTHRILHTTDGGKHWQDVTPPYPASYRGMIAPLLASLNGNVAWVAISNTIYRTSDGGHSWQQVTVPQATIDSACSSSTPRMAGS